MSRANTAPKRSKKFKKPDTTKAEAKMRRASYKMTHDYFSFENVVLAIAVALCISWTWRAISSMSRNWELAQRLATREKDLALSTLEVGNLEAENEYYKTAEYQELAARRQQNKKLSGETLIYLPNNTDAAKTKHATITVPVEEEDPPTNLEQWLSFLFGA